MEKSLLFTVLSVTLLASILSFSSMNTSVYAQQNQTGTENEAEIKADIGQENKCKKDSECENENELNNSLNIVNQQQNNTQTGTVTPKTCEECFTTILSSEQLEDFLINFSELGPEVTTVEQLCVVIEEQGVPELDDVIRDAAEVSGLTEDQYLELIRCLQAAGFDVQIPTPI